MSNSNEILKKCCRCRNLVLRSNFNKHNKSSDGIQHICVICFKDYHNERKERRSILDKERRKTDMTFKLHCSIREKTNRAFKSLNNKMNTLIGCSQSFFKRWILHQLYGDMTLENFGKIWCLDHCYPLSKIKENEFNKYTNWINIRPMYIKDNIIKGDKIDNRLYLLQQIKAKYFLKINNDQEGLN